MINVNKNIVLFYLGISFHMSIKHSLRLASTISSVLKTYSTLLWQSCKYQTKLLFLVIYKVLSVLPFLLPSPLFIFQHIVVWLLPPLPWNALAKFTDNLFLFKILQPFNTFLISLEHLTSVIYVAEPFSLLSLY